MMERIECGGLMERRDLCLVEVLGFDWRPGEACGILGKFGQAEISLSYLSIGNDAEGQKNMSFCVSTEAMAANRHIIDEIETEFKPTEGGGQRAGDHPHPLRPPFPGAPHPGQRGVQRPVRRTASTPARCVRPSTAFRW